METGQDRTRESSGPVGGGRLAWRKFALWLPGCLVLGVPVAWAAVVAQQYNAPGYFAPVIIFPLLVGVGLGALLVGLMRLGQVGNRPTVLLGTLLAVTVTVVGQHYVSYLMAYRWPWREITAQTARGQDLSELAELWIPSFPEFMRLQAACGRPPLTDWVAGSAIAPATWALWCIDGMLALLATLAMVVPATRMPFCDRCGSWYRVTRSGRIDAGAAGRLAELADARPQRPPISARYRLLDCKGGCGPTDFQLNWRQARGTAFSVRAWLDAERRDRIVRALDEGKAGDSP